MSTWSSLRNTEERCLTETPSSGSQPFSRGSAATSEAQRVEMNGEAEHVHLLIHYPPKHSVSSLVNSRKGVSSRLLRSARPDLENVIGTVSCGCLPTAPPAAAGHRWALLSNTSGKKRPHSNGPYIPGLKVRGFTARAVRSEIYLILRRAEGFMRDGWLGRFGKPLHC